MINQLTFNAITPAFTAAKTNRVKLTPETDSFIDILNKCIGNNLTLNSKITDEEFIQQIPSQVDKEIVLSENGEMSVINKDSGEDVTIKINQHELTLNEIVKVAQNRINAMSSFARNVIQPHVTNIVQNINMPQTHTVNEEWNLIPLQMSPLLSNPLVVSILNERKNAKDVNWEYEPFKLNIPENLTVPVTGSKNYDDLINNLINEESVSSILSRTLIGGSNISPFVVGADNNVNDKITQLLLLMYYADKPWNDSGVSSSTWDDIFTIVISSIISWIANYISNAEINDNNILIVNKIDVKNKTIYLNPKTYDSYIEAGGTPEALLGIVYYNQDKGTMISLTKESVIENLDKGQDYWARYTSVKKVKNDDTYKSELNKAIISALLIELDLINDEILHLDAPSLNNVKQQVREAVQKYYTVEDITASVILILGNYVFKEYQATQMLISIHNAIKNNCCPEEAAREFVIGYVLDWILNQINVE